MHRIVLAVLFTWLASPTLAAATAAVERAPAFLVAAPDRGFVGNQIVRDAFARFAPGRSSELVFVTDARSEPLLHAALDRLARRGVADVVVLPVFVSAAEARHALLRAQLQRWPNAKQRRLRMARPFGHHYLAVEALTARLRAAVPSVRDARCLIVGSGAAAGAADALRNDLLRLSAFARADVPGPACSVHVWADDRRDASVGGEAERLRRAVAEAGAQVVWPLHLGRHLDAMMRLDNALRAAVPDGVALLDGAALDAERLYQWLAQSANALSPLSAEAVGVVVHAHGADWHWNEQMRAALASLASQRPLEFAFSMGDPDTLADAIARLRVRGVRAVLVVRVFALHDSFAAGIGRLLGMDTRAAMPPPLIAAHDHDHGHDGANAAAAIRPPRIAGDIPMVTVGGIDDDPLFARALLANALEVATRPQRATLILVGHGSGDDATDTHWNALLRSLAAQMRKAGAPFRAIEVGTWREDWPEQRAAAVARIRALVAAAAADGGEAVVVPARTNGSGPEAVLLDGLDYRLGVGFAQHPLFAQWVENTVELGIAELRAAAGEDFDFAAPADWQR